MKKELLKVLSWTAIASLVFASCKNDEPTVIPEENAYNLDYKTEYATAWGNYMRIVAQLLEDDATTLYNDWNSSFNGGDSYAAQFKAHNGSIEGFESAANCLSQIIDGCIDIAGEVGEAKIGDPVNKWNAGNQTEALYAVESWYSWHSRDDYTNNIYSIRNAYYGNIYSPDANNYNTPATASIYNLIAAYNADLNTEVTSAIQTAADAIQAIPQPFRNNIASPEARAAQEACADLASVLEEKIKPLFENGLINDALLDPVIAQYVDQVVVPTYASLKAKSAALNTAVKTFVASPSDANFELCANAWLEAREPWETSEAFLFGPVADKGLDPNMDSWPLDQVGIVAILNSQAFDNLNWDGEYDEDSEAIESAQSLRGFHTLEYLIFKDGKARTIVE